MSLPAQTIALLQSARDLVKGLPADAALLLIEMPLDWDEVRRIFAGCRLFVASDNAMLLKPLRDDPDMTLLELSDEHLSTQERLGSALLQAVSEEKLPPGSHVVVLYNGIETQQNAPEPVDSLSVIHLGEHLEPMTAQDLRKLGANVPQDVLRAVVDLGKEIGREGREGQPIGTILVVGDVKKVQGMSRFLNFNPFRGYTRSERDVRDRKVREQIKEIAKLDGAILISRDGIAEAACVYLDVPTDDVQLSKGFGSRHLAAAGISRHSKAIAFCISQSSGTVRVFQHGEVKLHIEPLARPHVWQAPRLDVPDESEIEAGD